MPVNFATTETPKPVERVTVTKNLEGQDEHIDLLESYFKEMQKTTVETLTPDDLLSFATCAHYFGVIMLENATGSTTSDGSGDEDAEGEPEEETEAVSESAYPASSRPTSPPASSAASNFSITSPTGSTFEGEALPETDVYAAFAALSEQEKVMKWREAFLDKLEEGDDEPIVPPMQHNDLSDGMPSYAVEVPPPFLIPHSQNDIRDRLANANTNENPDNYINWPDDMPTEDDGAKLMENDGPFPSTEPLVDTNIYASIEPVVVDKEFGREYLEPEQYDTPVPELPDIPNHPKMEAVIYESAIRFRDELRARRVAEYERKMAARRAQQARPPPPSPLVLSPTKTMAKKPIGLIYLWTSQNFDDPLHIGECSMGFYIAPDYRKKEYLVDALNEVVKRAFSDKQCHRLQSILVENNEKLYTLELLTAAGFRHEGTRRRAFYSSIAQEWKDVTYLAMLATEWVYDNNNTSSSVRLRTSSLWDEILARHQREFDELHRLEEKTLKRSTSTETIRRSLNVNATVNLDLTDSETQSIANTETSASAASASVKRRRIEPGNIGQVSPELRRNSQSSGSGLGSDWEVPLSPDRSPTFARARQGSAGSSNAGPSRSRKRASGGLSFSSASSSTSSSSNWVMLDD